jgi:amino acid transporter
MPVSPLVIPYKPALKVSKLNAAIIHTMSIIVASILLWGVHYLILKGVETAAFINSIVTVAKPLQALYFSLGLMYHPN